MRDTNRKDLIDPVHEKILLFPKGDMLTMRIPQSKARRIDKLRVFHTGKGPKGSLVSIPHHYTVSSNCCP
jgi:hypothetical protein